jgi:hypothetical protein
MGKALRFWVGMAIIGIAFALPYFKSVDVKHENSVAQILKIEKPAIEILNKTAPIDNIVTDKKDRESLAVFTQVFSRRVPKYDTTTENFDKIFVFAGKEIYNTSMRGKYKGLQEFFTKTMEESIGDREGLATEEERNKLSKDFNSISWILSEGAK